jgi:ribose-phosphate pyrophosphokinase
VVLRSTGSGNRIGDQPNEEAQTQWKSITKKKLLVVGGRAHTELVDEICARLGIERGQIMLATFPNGELHCKFGESVRGADLFIVQTHAAPRPVGTINDAIMEHLIMVRRGPTSVGQADHRGRSVLWIQPPGPQVGGS